MLSETIRAGLLAAIERGWTYDAIALATEAPKQSIYDWANGQRGISAETLDKIALWLSVRATKPKPPPPPKRSPRGRPKSKPD